MAIAVFPSLPGQAWPLARTVLWKNQRQQSISGKSTVNQLWTYPQYQWSAPFNVLRSAAAFAEFQTLLGFINSSGSGALPFYFTDPVDNAVSAQSFGTGDGTTTAFQLVRSFGGFVEPVFSVNGVPAITVGGAATVPASISNMGVVTFAAAPGAGAAIKWTGSYYWLCRFDKDNTDFSEIMAGYFQLKTLSFTSEKL